MINSLVPNKNVCGYPAIPEHNGEWCWTQRDEVDSVQGQVRGTGISVSNLKTVHAILSRGVHTHCLV